MAKRHERTLARRQAVQVLYSAEINDITPDEAADNLAWVLEDSEEGPLLEYALTLVAGVEGHKAEIDSYLADTSENWSLMRMPIVDRSILRVALYEMLYETKVPVSVAINEAVELAKAFGGEDESPRFVNGVLGRIARQRGGSDAGVAAEAGSAAGAQEVGAQATDAAAADAAVDELSDPVSADEATGAGEAGE